MRSTFMGLETSKRGMFTQQSALYTTGHNLSNANTIGYSRQRVNMEASTPYPGIGLNSGTTPGFIGTGSQAHSVQRIRDQFVDRQFRQEANSLGYWESKSQAISQMEDVMREPSEFGINETLDLFWKSLEDLGNNPQTAGTRRVIIERGVNVAEAFNNIHAQLSDIQGNLKNEIDIQTKKVNSILQQIADINHSIQKIEPNGYMPNDLYDARDVLLDELSGYFPIEIVNVPSGGNALKIAEGSVTVSIKTKNGSIKVVEGKEASQLVPDYNNLPVGTNVPPFNEFKFVGGPAAAGSTLSPADMSQGTGQMLSLINSYGYGIVGDGEYPQMIEKINAMAMEFAKEFNKVHEVGFGLPPNNETGLPFFVSNGGVITAADIFVNNNIRNDESKLAASSRQNEVGNGENALKLAKVKDAAIINGASTQTYYQTIIGEIGVKGEQANSLAETSATKLLTIANGRAAVSSVSVDEEMTNMITFQQAYNASARMLTAVDEILDRIINGMGRVGQ